MIARINKSLRYRFGRVVWYIQRALIVRWYTDKNGVTCGIYHEDTEKSLLRDNAFFDDPGVLRWVENFLKPGMTVFDVGASRGVFTLFAARCVQPGGSVHTFEPTSLTYYYLRRNVQHNRAVKPTIHLNQMAVANTNGTQTFYLFSPDLAQWNTLVPHTMIANSAYQKPRRTETVRVTTLTAYCQQQGIDHIDLLKIDVEGVEGDVLDGAAGLLKEQRIGAIIFEISMQVQEQLSLTAAQLVQKLIDTHYQVGVIHDDGTITTIDNVTQFEFPFFANYVALPHSSGEALSLR